MSKRTCPKCSKDYLSTNLARHLRTCKGPVINGKRQCQICLKWYVRCNLSRHIRTQHADVDNSEDEDDEDDEDELTQLRTENRRLLESENRRLRELISKKNKQLDKNNRTVNSSIELPHYECSYSRPLFTAEHRARILDSQGNVCVVCKFKPTPIQLFTTMAVDHIKEKQELGYYDNSRDNLQVLCHSCNTSKARDVSWALKQEALRQQKKFKRQLEQMIIESSSDGSSSGSDLD